MNCRLSSGRLLRSVTYVPGHKPEFATVCMAMWGAGRGAGDINTCSLRAQYLAVIEENDPQLITGYVQTITNCGD